MGVIFLLRSVVVEPIVRVVSLQGGVMGVGTLTTKLQVINPKLEHIHAKNLHVFCVELNDA